MEKEEYIDNRIKLRCTNKDCELSKGFFTSPKFRDVYLNELKCLLCGSKHADEIRILETE